MADLGHELDRRALEWRVAGQELVERGAQAVDVGACVHRVGVRAGALGGHIDKVADHLAGLGDLLHRELGEPLGEHQVAELGDIVRLADEDVRRLDVAVDDLPLRRGLQRAGNLGANLKLP